MNALKSTKLWRTLFVVSGGILAVATVGGGIAYDQSAAINSHFNLDTFRVVKKEGSEKDSNYFPRQYEKTDELKEYTDRVCRELEQEGMVLLKNENAALPLAKQSKVSLFGQGSVSLNYASTGSSSTETGELPNLKEALKDFSVNPTLWDFYTTGEGAKYKRGMPNLTYKMNEAPWSAYGNDVKESFLSYNDAAIYVMSRDSGEGKDISTVGSDGIDGSYLCITENEKEVLKQLTSLKAGGTFSKVILILNSPVTIQLDFLFEEGIDIDAALWVGNLGSTGVHAINDVLGGDVSPSGRLSDTYCKDNFSSPAMASWALNANKSFAVPYANAADYPAFNNTQNVYGVYNEGIYVGYRYYETRYADKLIGTGNAGDFVYDDLVAYPFGHGLSYTDFYYSNFVMEDEGDHFLFQVDVMNIGGVAGKEAVELYMQKPYTDYDKANGVEKSAIELVAFEKTKLLDVGDFETVELRVEKEQLKSYDANLAKTYIVDEGDYFFSIGKDSHNALNNILDYNGYFTDDLYVDSTMVLSYHQDEFDKDTYSHSPINPDVEITNRFDFSDINKYDGRGSNSVTYVSRSNWEGTFPSHAEILSITPQMEKDILSFKALPEEGYTMPKYGEKNNLSLIMLRSSEEEEIAYDDPKWDKLLDQTTFAEQSLLITNGQHNTVLMQSINKPASKDENGPNGVSGSLTKATFPSEGIWASTFNKELLEEVGKCLAEDALAAGITGLYAPGVNLHRAPFGGRAHEYFSEDPYLMGIASVQETIGMQSKGVLAYVKHYAVNDEETNRNGVGIWLNEQEMREIVLLPFEYSFRPDMGNAHATMTSFNRIGCLWTSASSALMEDVLRDEWGFDGFSITDMASSNAKTYMTYVDGIANGTNLYDGAGSANALDQYANNAFFAQKMRDSTHRILYTMVNHCAVMNGISEADELVSVNTWWQNTIIGLRVGAGVLTGVTFALLCVSVVLNVKKEN